MLLVVDIGNTEAVLGVYKETELKATWRLSSKNAGTDDECWILLKLWCEDRGIQTAEIRGAVISSVVPSLTAVFQSLLSKYLGIEPVIVSAGLETGVKIEYESPQQVGADRICNAVACIEIYGVPSIVVDLGTATTFDVISEKAVYLGGAIALGLMGASNELHRLAAKLPRVDHRFPEQVVGRNTEQSMQSGIMWGAVSMIDGMVEKIIQEMRWSSVEVIGTGGTAGLVAARSRTIRHINPYLTLEGMRIIYHRVHEQ